MIQDLIKYRLISNYRKLFLYILRKNNQYIFVRKARFFIETSVEIIENFCVRYPSSSGKKIGRRYFIYHLSF